MYVAVGKSQWNKVYIKYQSKHVFRWGLSYTFSHYHSIGLMENSNQNYLGSLDTKGIGWQTDHKVLIN